MTHLYNENLYAWEMVSLMKVGWDIVQEDLMMTHLWKSTTPVEDYG